MSPQDPKPMRRSPVPRAELVALAAIVLVGLALRVAYVLALRAHPAFDAPTMDAGYHWAWARALAAGVEFQEGPFFRAPLYPLWLGAWAALCGDATTLAPRLAQAALGAATIALTWALGRRIGALAGRARSATVVGLGAAALVATMWSLIAYDAELLIPTLSVPLGLAALLATARALELPTQRRALLAGALFGLTAIARPNILLCLPVPLWMAARRGGRRAALALALGTLAPILPVTLHNALEGDAALISTQAGVNLWIGNNPLSDGSTAIVPGTRGGWWEGYHDAIAAAEHRAGHALQPSEVSRHYTARALAFAGEQPGQALGLLAWKARLFAHDAELGNNTDPRFIALRFAPWLAWTPGRFGWLFALGAVGLALAARRGGVGRLVAGCTLLYAASVVLFFVNARFRLPVVPGLAVGAVFLVERLRVLARGEGPRGRRGRTAGFIALAVGGLLVAAYLPLPHRRDGRASGLMDLAKAELARGAPRVAATLLEEALALEPNEVFARVAYASALQQSGEPARALRLMEETRRLPEGDRPEVIAQLVDALVDAGRAADAQRAAEESLARDPLQPALRYGLARALGAQADANGARRELLQVLRDEPSAAHAAFALGQLEEAVGDRAAARAAYARVVALKGRTAPGLVAAAEARLLGL